uniref:Uncharacterized protein n=1 Tax=Panagrolaimus davidi TaxID=227884 RepID=A0A914R439_9BILA
MGKKGKRTVYKPFKIPDECYGLRTDEMEPAFEKSTFGQRVVSGYINEEDRWRLSPCRKAYPYLEYMIWEYISKVKESDAMNLATHLRARGEANSKVLPGVQAVTQSIKALHDCVLEMPFLQVQPIGSSGFKIFLA